MSDNKPTNVFQLGSKRNSQGVGTVGVSNKTLVDQDPGHTPASVSQELFYAVKPGTEQEVVDGIKAIRSHYLDLLTTENDTLPMLILSNSCQFPGSADKPTAELQALRRRFIWTVNTYFGQPNKICKRIKDAADEFFMQIRLLMFADNSITGHRLADESSIGLRITISEIGVVTTWCISGFPDHSEFIPHFPD